jgi:hypothetical protein
MGSPSARLNTPEYLRTWVESGLEFLYAPGHAEQPAASVQAPARPRQALTRQASPQPSPQMSERPQQPPVTAAAQAPAQAPPRVAQPVQPGPGVAPRQTSAQPRFPEPWAAYFAKVAPTPRIVWTYMELGLDLAGQADPRRGSVLRNLIAHLRWPKGTTAFWPVAALRDGALQPDPAMFWNGWKVWKTPDIACFGHEALRVIQPEADGACTTCFLESTTIHVLPSLSELMTMLPHEQQMAVDVLAALRF